MVKWVSLCELENDGFIKMGRGNVISKIDIESTPGYYPVYSSSSKGNGEIGRYGKYMFDDERITWSIDGGGKFFYRHNEKYSVTNVCGWIKVLMSDKLSTKYLYYTLSFMWENFSFDYSHKAHPSVIRNKYVFFLPTLAEQQRIVDILDKFEGMVENVEKELTLRQKQYEYYREKMITSRHTETLSNYVTAAKDRISANELNADNYVSVENLIKDKGGKTISYSVPTTGNWIKYEKGDILIGNIRPYLRKIWLADNKGGTNGDVIVLRSKDKNKYLPKYLYELLADDDFFVYYSATVKDGKMPRGAKEKIFEYQVSVPPLEKQQEIVAKLDVFEEMINNLKEELELRKKQYEYYREKLLTFE